MYKEKSAYREAIRNEGHRKFVPREYNLKEIFNDEKLASKLGQNARGVVSKKYKVQNINEKIYKIYKNFLQV